MSLEGNGKLADHGPKKVIAINCSVPADFEPAFAVNVIIDQKGKIVMDADWNQFDLVAHLSMACMNTVIIEARKRLLQAAKEQSLIQPPGDFRV